MVKIDPQDLSLHDRATMIPDMSGEEMQELLSSLKTEGQLVPITVTPARVIVDGRHRWEAAKILGWESVLCEIIDLPEDMALQYMVTTAIIRRHLTAGQKAAILIQYDEVLKKAFSQREPGVRTRDILAEKAQVSDRTMQDAMTLKVLSPQKFHEVQQGKVSVKEALRQVKGEKPPTFRFVDEKQLRVLAQRVADQEIEGWQDWLLELLEAMFGGAPAAAIFQKVVNDEVGYPRADD